MALISYYMKKTKFQPAYVLLEMCSMKSWRDEVSVDSTKLDGIMLSLNTVSYVPTTHKIHMMEL